MGEYKSNRSSDNSHDLSMTMQQRFNFDSNKFDEEDTQSYKIKKKIRTNLREKELINLKNRYKKKFTICFFTSIIFFFLCVTICLLYVFVKPKVVTKEVIKVKNVMDENIVFLGDSITYQYELGKYYENVHYVNSGISGNTTDDILKNMYERVYRYNPSKVFILIGTNDYIYGEDNDHIYDNIVDIISKIKEERPHTKIYLQSIYPINNSSDKQVKKEMVRDRKNEDISKVNERLEKYCKKNKIVYIDVYKELLNDDKMLDLKYSIEGLHLNDEGYELVTDILRKYIKD